MLIPCKVFPVACDLARPEQVAAVIAQVHIVDSSLSHDDSRQRICHRSHHHRHVMKARVCIHVSTS
jgi:hypothetical protein